MSPAAGFDAILGQPEALNILRNYLGRTDGRLPTSYLFHGPEGTGKFTAAVAFASGLTGQVPSPQESGLSPDLLVIDEAGGTIKIEQVQELIQKLGLKPANAPCKVAVINDAENMTRESANCLLKTLEEPTASTRIILVSSRPDDLLPTIHSRCVKVRFHRLAPETVRDILLRLKPGLSADELENLALLSEGSIKTALELADEETYSKIRAIFREAVHLWEDHKRRAAADYLACAEVFAKSGSEGKLIFSKLLDILTLYWRDLLVQNSSVEGIETRTAERPLAATPQRIQRILSLLSSIRQDLDSNANIRLAFEHILLEVRRILNEQGA
jgi:DNA polymerase-3 subunit delta'